MHFIQTHNGIDRIRFLTLPVARTVHWHPGANNKRRPINCSIHNCLLCADGAHKSDLNVCIGYDHRLRQQGVVELLSAVYSAFKECNKDLRLYDAKIEVLEPRAKYSINIIGNKQEVIKPTNDMLVELSNRIIPYTSSISRQELYRFDPGFVQSVITTQTFNIYQKVIDTALREIEKTHIKIISYMDANSFYKEPFEAKLPNKNVISFSILAARRLESGELYSHATERVLYKKSPRVAFSPISSGGPLTIGAGSGSGSGGNLKFARVLRMGSAMYAMPVALLVHEDGDFKFVPDLNSIINEAKFEGLLS